MLTAEQHSAIFVVVGSMLPQLMGSLGSEMLCGLMSTLHMCVIVFSEWSAPLGILSLLQQFTAIHMHMSGLGSRASSSSAGRVLFGCHSKNCVCVCVCVCVCARAHVCFCEAAVCAFAIHTYMCCVCHTIH